LQKAWLPMDGEHYYDHSRIFGNWGKGYLDRTRGNGGKHLPDGYNSVAKTLDERRMRIDDAYDQAEGLIEALGLDVPQDWTRELRRGARTGWFTAHGITDCLHVYAAYREHEQGRPLSDLGELERGIRSRARLWEVADPEMFGVMGGGNAVRIVEELREKAGR